MYKDGSTKTALSSLVPYLLALGLMASGWMCGCERDGSEIPATGTFVAPNAPAAPDDLWKTVPPAPPVSLGDRIPDGERAVFFELDAHQAFGGELGAGDRVDIIFHAVIPLQPPRVNRDPSTTDEVAPSHDVEERSKEKTRAISGMVLQNVKVLSVERSGGQRRSWTVAVSATPLQAQTVRAVQARCELSFLLRHPQDFEERRAKRKSLRDLLADLDEFTRVRRDRQEKRRQDMGREAATTRERLAQRVRRRMRAYALRADLTPALVRQLRSGAHMDVSATLPVDDNDKLADASSTQGRVDIGLLQNVRVLDALAPDDEEAGGEPLLLLEVSTDEAKLLALAAARGELDVTIRAPGDNDIESSRRKTTRDAIEDREPIVIRERRKRRIRRRRYRRRRPAASKEGIKMYRGSGRTSAAKAAPKKKKSEVIDLWGGSKSSTKPSKQPASQPASQVADSKVAHSARSAKEVEHERFVQASASTIVATREAPRSTFALDVDTSSYTLARRHIREGELPPDDAVRVEEYLNYFDYDNPWPEEKPFAVTVEGAPSPFRQSARHKLVRVGVQAKKVNAADRQPLNLTIVVDTSSSMRGGDRMGMVKDALAELAKKLRTSDTIGIVGYGDGVTELLGRTDGDKRKKILLAIRSMKARGKSAMQAGLVRGYKLAGYAANDAELDRVVLLSDGAPNVGARTHEALLDMVSEERSRGIALTSIGFGRGNYGDNLMEQLADNGDGNSYYLDNRQEAKRLFGERLLSTLVMVARDVKAQVEFDPTVVESYRRIGYQNRAMSDDDWHDASADAGEIGAGHRITVLYEVRLQENAPAKALGTVKVRYRELDGDEPLEIRASLAAESMHDTFEGASADMRFAAGVAGFAEILAQTPLGAYLSLTQIHQTVKKAAGKDPARLEFTDLVERARELRAAQGDTKQARSER